uniref:avidin n=1 Tax=Pristiophorus japonicus TaxID=55135 RepID=UPI00398E7D8B
MQPAVWYLALVLSTAAISIDASTAHSKPTISGCWENELGSVLAIDVDGAGQVNGRYRSKVAEGRSGAEGSVVGSYQSGNLPTFGFVVKWASPGTTEAISVWTGQYFMLNDKEVLDTMWLLRNNVRTESMNWDATRVGMDIFYRREGTCPI